MFESWTGKGWIMAGPFDKFTVRAKRVMQLAQEEARGFNHNYIGTEHILLGLVAEGEGIGARILVNLGVQPSEVREAIVFTIGRGEGEAEKGELSLVPRAKRVLELALDEARELGHHYIGTEHLLLGLVREGEGVGVGILAGLGVTRAQVGDQLSTLLETESRSSGTMREKVEMAVGRLRGRRSSSGPAEVKGNVITCRVTDQDLAVIDALVETGIRTTRSDAASWLISAGVEARRDVLDKVFATIEGIRQLRAEARAIAEQAGMGAAPAPAPVGEKVGEGVKETAP
jgi:ATP-dependent Clp protease ATP-binding subunit ClpA